MKRLLRARPVGRVAGAALDALLATSRFSTEGAAHYQDAWGRGEPVIFVLWHGRLLPLAYLHRGQGVVGLVSQSRDGEQIAALLDRWGFGLVRGSSSRGGGRALRELVRHVRAGRSLAITPDGPRGPRQKMKLGPLVTAQVTGRLLVPVAAAADRAWWPGDWDRFLVPRPFARVRVIYGEPRRIPRNAGAAELERHAAELELELNRLVDAADADAAAPAVTAR